MHDGVFDMLCSICFFLFMFMVLFKKVQRCLLWPTVLHELHNVVDCPSQWPLGNGECIPCSFLYGVQISMS